MVRVFPRASGGRSLVLRIDGCRSGGASYRPTLRELRRVPRCRGLECRRPGDAAHRRGAVAPRHRGRLRGDVEGRLAADQSRGARLGRGRSQGRQTRGAPRAVPPLRRVDQGVHRTRRRVRGERELGRGSPRGNERDRAVRSRRVVARSVDAASARSRSPDAAEACLRRARAGASPLGGSRARHVGERAPGRRDGARGAASTRSEPARVASEPRLSARKAAPAQRAGRRDGTRPARLSPLHGT
jgi:hypothetical protein